MKPHRPRRILIPGFHFAEWIATSPRQLAYRRHYIYNPLTRSHLATQESGSPRASPDSPKSWARAVSALHTCTTATRLLRVACKIQEANRRAPIPPASRLYINPAGFLTKETEPLLRSLIFLTLPARLSGNSRRHLAARSRRSRRASR